ncbi:hypothetical protein V12B01_12770 [Vibrio splendidus 12B01]|nr:hypothetical protein V12B01_12770 [Vibrio splendidus 12B01]
MKTTIYLDKASSASLSPMVTHAFGRRIQRVPVSNGSAPI